MPKRLLNKNVFDAAIERFLEVYEAGHRVVVSFSGGKDSGICVDLAAIAAKQAGRLPVEVVMRDEEIMFPGTFEYCERMAAREDISFHWMYACQPIINMFNRENPYWWVFDPALPPDKWVRRPPPIAYRIEDKAVTGLITTKRFPPPEGKELYAVVGLRAIESTRRRVAIMTAGSHLIKKNGGVVDVRGLRPIYDWTDEDVWYGIHHFKWDYNDAYDVMARFGIPRNLLRIAPPSMAPASARAVGVAAKAWPKWFDKVCERVVGLRAVALFGRQAVMPRRRLTEDWEGAFHRLCIDEAPDWIAKRSLFVKEKVLAEHNRHSTTPFPQNVGCRQCKQTASWRAMTMIMYNGDPFTTSATRLPFMEPEFFREGAGKWGGRPTF
jgi:predicted phosphoadenosine phosphosulfate sulfurtransferase